MAMDALIKFALQPQRNELARLLRLQRSDISRKKELRAMLKRGECVAEINYGDCECFACSEYQRALDLVWCDDVGSMAQAVAKLEHNGFTPTVAKEHAECMEECMGFPL